MSFIWSVFTSSTQRCVAALLVLCVFCFSWGFTSIQPMDRDEPRFAQASKQMIESGDYIDIRFQEEARHKKPVGIYWLQVAAVTAAQALGFENAKDTISVYRVPSFIGALCVVLLTFWLGSHIMSREAAFFAACLMAFSILLNVEARLAKTDAVLTAAVLFTMTVLFKWWQASRQSVSLAFWPWPFFFWLVLGVGLLIKGPLILLVLGLSLLGLVIADRKALAWRELYPFRGLLIVMAVALPWFIAIALDSRGQFFQASLGHDLGQKLVSGHESHGAPPGTYLVAMLGTFFPGSLLAFLAAPLIFRLRREPVVIWLLCWLLPAWVVMEIVPTKLPHYVLPLYPALALLCAYALYEKNGFERLKSSAFASVLWAWPLLVFVLFAVVLVGVYRFEGALLLGVFFLFVFSVSASFIAVRRPSLSEVTPALMLTMVFVYAGVLGLAAPQLSTLWVSQRLAAFVQKSPCSEPALVSSGFREPSLVFLTRTDLVMRDGADAAKWLKETSCGLAFVEKRHFESFERERAALGYDVKSLGRVDGININGGRRLSIDVFLREASR